MFEGTTIGADGIRYPTGTQPTDPKPYRRASAGVSGVPDAGKVPAWNSVSGRLEWMDPLAGGVGALPPDSQVDLGTMVPARRYDVATAGIATISGTLFLHYFLAAKTESVAQIQTYCTGALGATPTLCRMGIYEVNPTTGDGTLLTAIPNDPTLWSAVATYTRPFTTAFAKVRGTRYAVGSLIVSTFAMGAIAGPNTGTTTSMDVVLGRAPRISGTIAGQTNLPASFTEATVVNNRRCFGCYLA